MARTNEEQLDLFAELLEPCAEILSDKDISKVFKEGQKPILAVKAAIKNHKEAIVAILAALDGSTPEAYVVPSPPVLAAKIIGFLNSPEAKELFFLQDQTVVAGLSGSATESTEGNGG